MTVRLMHLDEPCEGMRHCLVDASREPGETKMTCFERARAAGAVWRVARTWDTKDQDFARRLRDRGEPLSFYCPICSGKAAYRRAAGIGRWPEGPGRFSVRVDEQNAFCLNCSLRDCVGTEQPRCPINIEQRRRWRACNNARRALARQAALNA